MNELEMLGDVATGGVIARAVEPRDGEGPGSHATVCLNCGAALSGEYCHRCGQAGHVHRTLGAFGHDLLHGVLHFEGKIWRTLPMLAWHPGALTRRYVAGERARFVSPLALFLFCVFLTFAVIGWTGGPLNVNGVKGSSSFQTGLAREIADQEVKVTTLETQRAAVIAAGRSTASIDGKLKDTRDEASLLRLMRDRGVTAAGMVRASDDLPSAPAWIQHAYEKAKANPSLLLYKLQNNAYKYSWALIPISVPFMWLLFPFSRRFRMYDHAVFVTYSLCFVTLLVVAASLVKVAGGPGPLSKALIGIVPVVHMYRQLRGAYGLGRWSALARTVLLLAFCMVASVLFVLLLVALGVLG